jgi:tetratricopeptide (TPR) repeat protein
MRKITLILLISLVSINLFSSEMEPLLDSLKIAQENNDIKKQIDLYLKIGYRFNANQQFNKAIYYYNQGLSIAQEKEVKAKYLNKIGQVLVDSANYSEALINLDKSVKLYDELKPNADLASTYILIGMCYGLTNNLDSALISFKNALEVNIQLKDSSGIGVNYYNIGLVHHFKSQYDGAVKNYLKSLEIREAIQDTSAIIASLTSIGEIFRLRHEYDKAMKYYMQALSYKESLENSNVPRRQLNKNIEILAYIYSEVGLIHKAEKNYKDAILYFDTALVYSREINYKRGIATIATYKAGIEYSLKDFTSAKKLYEESLEAYQIINFGPGISQALISLAEIEIEFKNYTKAISMLDSAWSGAIENNLLEEQTNISQLRMKAFRGLGNTEKALSFYDQHVLLKDSLFNIDREKQIEEIETKFQTEKKEKQIEILNQETELQKQKLKNQRLFLLSIIVIVLFVIIIGFLFFRQNKLKSELQVEQNRQKLLRSQMNPHFIYNSLSAIQNFILSNDPMESVSYISEFSGLMRMVLEHSRRDLISLKEDVDFANIYLKLQKLRFSDKFDYQIKIDQKINPEIIKIPPMLTQPFIENAVEHGMRQIEKNGLIMVDYKIDQNNLLISVSDNGKGLDFENKTKENHNSLATKITRERIENIFKLLKVKINMEITEAFQNEENKGVKVEFRIPQIK